MSVLEIALSIALAIAILQSLRLYRKQMILRHLFIRSSDWCARKIDEMTEDAKWHSTNLQKEWAEAEGRNVTDEDALGNIPCDILDAKKEWSDQKEAFQSCLVRNGIRQLDASDLDDLILDPGLFGFKQ